MVLPVRVLWLRTKTSCLTTAFLKILSSVLGRVSCLVYLVRSSCHMRGSKTRRCKETIQQVKERLVREQANRTKKRVEELLDLREEGSDSDSEGSQDDSIDEYLGSLSLVRRDLYLCCKPTGLALRF